MGSVEIAQLHSNRAVEFILMGKPGAEESINYWNSANTNGGGKFSTNSNRMVLINVLIFKNQATFGGGLANGNTSGPHIINSTLAANSANDEGGGLCNYQNSSPSAVVNSNRAADKMVV